MIEVGNTIITAITIGTASVQRIDWGSDQVWPVNTGHSITISPSSTAVTSAAQTTYITISVTADTNTWTVSTSSSWITDLEKRSNSQARFKVSGNTAIDGRTGIIEFKIDGDTYATYTVTQAAAAPVISLYPTSIEKEFNGTTGTVYVTTNIPSWQAYKQPDVSWASITANTNSIDYYIAANTGEVNRRFWIVASGMGVSAETEVFQYAGYVFRTSDGTTSRVVSSGGGSFSIMVVSQYQGNRTPASYSIGRNDIGLEFASSGQTDVGYYFAFGVPARTAITSGMAAITFTQTESNRTIGYQVYQNAAAPAVIPSGVTSAATYGQWVLGTITTVKNTGPGGNYDVKGIAIVRDTPIDKGYTATVSMTYYYGVPTTGYTVTDETLTLTQGEEFTVNNVTYYGYWLHLPQLNQGISQVTKFTVLTS